MYFTIQITRENGTTAKTLFSFDDEKRAKANHFYFLSSSYANNNIDYILAEVIDEEGIVLCREIYKREEKEG